MDRYGELIRGNYAAVHSSLETSYPDTQNSGRIPRQRQLATVAIGLVPIAGPQEGDDWAAHAACRNISNPDIFYPDENKAAKTKEAKQLCQSCPVRTDCLDHALENNETEGIWGGLTSRERKQLRARWMLQNS